VLNRKLVVVGASSEISQALKALYEPTGVVQLVGRGTLPPLFDTTTSTEIDFSSIDTGADHYCINIGYLSGKNANEISDSEALKSIQINLIFPVKIAEYILRSNPKARVVIVGSESGTKGSYDTYYFLAKAALNKYIQERQITYPLQTLNIVCPSMIKDGNMTVSRADQDRVELALKSNPKQQPLMARDVAMLIHNLLLEGSGFLTNQIIGIDGGKFARMNIAGI
jgi:NAD(P)-dependent dehydrogenase (short-subunit alcohol dehydrogenase family)